ncbi:MAG TPA: hypothetical protein ENO22_13475 [candidate division Zixibacteria bacterium]|mgnify:CR=1 FL=1|nr:hypothetical protein [candidate division Zixibacteria bacterium]
MTTRILILISLLWFWLCLNSFSSADRLGDNEASTYRTKDSVLLELLEAKKQLPPSIIKNADSARQADLSMMRAFGLSAPTSNMLKYDINHYRIDIVLDFAVKDIHSEVTITGTALQDGLSLIDLTFKDNYIKDNVSVNGAPASNLHNGELFTVYLPEPIDSGETFQITVQYYGYPIFSGTPHSGVGGGLSYAAQYTSQICQTECEPFGSRNWFPCKDFPFDKADSVDLLVTHPNGMTTSANGLLQSITDNGDGTATTHWKTRYPITTYVIHFVTAYQQLYEQQWEYAPGDTMPVVVYAYDGYSQGVNNYLTYTIPGLDIFSEIFGLYPFVEEKYGNSFYDLWGMENQTMTVLVPPIAVEWIIIHEMAHHWWGNLITCKNFHHVWLNEGFATYAEALYYEYLYGIDYYHDYIQSQACLNVGSVYVEDLDNDDIFDGATSYNKGSRVLHMLRGVVGDSAIIEILQNYQSDPELRYGWATTADFQAHAEAVYGSSLDWFFDQWIYQPGNPHYEYGWINLYDSVTGNHQLGLQIFQIQTEDPYNFPLFSMPVQIQVFYDSQDTVLTVFNNSLTQTYLLDIPMPADSVKFDPDRWILSTVLETQFAMGSTTKTLDTASLTEYYYLELEAIGGTPPYSWELIFGQLPYGVTLQNEDSSYLAGYPNYASEFNFTLRVTDSSDPQKTDDTRITIVVLDEGYVCGDANNDALVNVSDAVWIINYVFVGGSAPVPWNAGEVNCDGNVNVSDAVWIINYVFVEGAAPCDC